MANPLGAHKGKDGNWYTNKSNALLQDTGGGTSYSYYARGKNGKTYFYDPRTQMYTANRGYQSSSAVNDRRAANGGLDKAPSNFERREQEAHYAGQRTLSGGAPYNANKQHNINQATSDLSNYFQTRKQAFDYARAHGATGFMYKNGQYNTRSAGESVNDWTQRMNANYATHGKDLMQGLNQGATGIYNNSKYIGFNEDNNGNYHQRTMGNTKTGVELDPASKVVHKKGTGHTYYDSAYDHGELFNNLIFGSLSPTRWLGAYGRAKNGQGFGGTLLGRTIENMYGWGKGNAEANNGLFSLSDSTQKWAIEHPKLAATGNFIADAAIAGLASRASGDIFGGLKSGAGEEAVEHTPVRGYIEQQPIRGNSDFEPQVPVKYTGTPEVSQIPVSRRLDFEPQVSMKYPGTPQTSQIPISRSLTVRGNTSPQVRNTLPVVRFPQESPAVPEQNIGADFNSSYDYNPESMAAGAYWPLREEGYPIKYKKFGGKLALIPKYL